MSWHWLQRFHHISEEDIMDIRRAKTLYGIRMHRTAMGDAAGRGDGQLTFCNRSTSLVEPETEGHIEYWNHLTRQMGDCVRCVQAVQKLAEGG